jgi:hypothetical protein
MVAIAHRTERVQERIGLQSKSSMDKAIVQARRESLLYRNEAQTFAAVQPPAEVAVDHVILIRNDRALAQQWARLAQFLAHPNGTQPPPPFGIGIEATYRALSDLRAKGYDLGPITGQA